jgi:isopropylmalate/homocitrate/citramalate synthase
MVQGTINGYGERCGNADLVPIMANLEIKMNKPCLPGGALKDLTRLSLFVSEIANITPLNSRPFVGRSAFAHKGGVHVHAVLKNTEAYEHIRPESPAITAGSSFRTSREKATSSTRRPSWGSRWAATTRRAAGSSRRSSTWKTKGTPSRPLMVRSP